MAANKLLETINAAAEAPDAELSIPERMALLQAVEKLRGAYETSMDIAIRVMLAPHISSTLRVAVDMKLFDIAAAKNGPVTIAELSVGVGADGGVTKRVMRMMTGLGLFTETALDTYTLTPNGAGFVSASPLSAAVHNLFQMGQLTTHIPSFLARTSYANPTDALHTPFQDAMDTELTYFDWIKARPVDHEMFNRTMALNQAWRGVSWFEYFPVASKLSSSSEETLLVDVGGGVGIDILAFQKAFPDLKGKLVLQDLPSVVDGLQLPQGVKAQGHDFFSPQPVKNAKAYYMRNILHDWPDKQALQILGHVKEAMGKESLLLVNEGVVPEMGTSLMQAQFDINMMGIGALDRTEREYENLFESAGLRVVGRHVPEVLVLGTGTVFEVVLA